MGCYACVASFTLAYGQLTYNGLYVSTNPDVQWAPFTTGPLGGIGVRWFLQDGELFWRYPTCQPDGLALFCETPAGQINILFNGFSDPGYPPDFNCEIVTLRVLTGMSTTLYPSPLPPFHKSYSPILQGRMNVGRTGR